LTPTFTMLSTFYGYTVATYYQADTWQGQWQSFNSAGINRTPALTPGEHILYAFAADGQAATSINTGFGSSPLIGNMTAYWFLVGQDSTSPTVTLATTAISPTNQPFTVTATFSEPVTGFDSSKVSVTNGTIGSFSGSDTDYSFNVTPTGASVTVNVAAGAGKDAAGNDNTAATPLVISYDNTSPNATITGGGTTVNAPFTVTISFDKAVTGLSLANITVSNGTASSLANVTPNLVWTVLITPTGRPGQPVVISVTGVNDSTGNSNTVTPLATMVQPTAALSTTAINFGGITTGTGSDTREAVFTNTSNGAVTIDTITKTGTDQDNFSLTGTCANVATISAGASCTMAISFNPTFAGTKSAAISVTSNASGSPHTVTLSGNGTVSANSIVIDPNSATTLFAGLDGAGVFRSVDSGANWTAATVQPTNLRIKALAFKAGDSTTLYAASYGNGVFKSVNSGDSWAACAVTGLTNLNLISLVIDGTGKLYAGTEGGVFVSADGCGTWTAMNGGLPN